MAAPPAAPPVVGGAHVFAVLRSGVISAHRIADGLEAWSVELRADQPVSVEGNTVFVAAGEAIHALRADDRTVLWRTPAGTLTAPMLSQGGWVIAASNGTLAAYRSADGTLVWHQESGEQRERATIEGDNLYVPLADGRLAALDLATGRKRWEQRFDGAPTQVLAFPDRIYVGAADKYFYCLNAGSGEMEWHQRVGAVLRGQPVADESRVFVAAMDNVLRAFDRRSGALLWHQSVPFRPTTGPVLVGSAVVVPGTTSELRAFEVQSGRAAGAIKLPEPLAIPPAFGEFEGTAVMAAFTGGLSNEWKLSLLGPAPAAAQEISAPATASPPPSR